MVKMLVCYKPPADAEAFERRYLDGHLPLVRRYEHLADCSFARVSRTLVGETPYSHIFTGVWPERDGFKADMASPIAAEATEDAQRFATAGFDVFLLEELS